MFTLWLGCSSEHVKREATQILNSPRPRSEDSSRIIYMRPGSDFAYRQGEIVIADSGVYVVYEVRFGDPFAVTRQWHCPACGREVTIQRGLTAGVGLARQLAASRESGFFRCMDKEHRVVGYGQEVPGEVRASWYYRDL